MDLNPNAFAIPQWNIAHALQENRAAWTRAFDKSYCSFAKKLSEVIAADIFTALKESCDDPFKLQPTDKRTFTRIYRFDMLKAENALKLKEMSQEAGEVAPFDEWFARFAVSEKKIEKIVQNQPDLLEDSCGMVSGVSTARKISVLTRTQENNTPVDGSYFEDRMAIIGKRVCANLREIFSQFAASPGNERLKVSVTWLAEGLEIGSIRNSPDVMVELWLQEEKGTQKLALQSVSEQEIVAQMQARRKNQYKNRALEICAIFALIAGFFAVLKSP